MPPRTVFVKIARFFRLLYLKLFRINDSPQRIAIGLGIGVFSGVLPGTGPIAALGLAFIFRVNRASALLGSIITNTWLSIPVFLLSLKAGALLTGLRYHEIRTQWELLLKDFHWAHLLNVSVYDIIGPILIGYFAVAACIGFAAYLACLIAVTYSKKKIFNFWTIASLLGVCIFFILMRWHLFDLPLMRDEGEYAYSAWLLRHDIAPYQYAFLQKPPMIIYTYALAQFISPAIYWIPRILDYSFIACATVLIGLVAQMEFGGSAGLIVMWLFTPMVQLPGSTQSAAVIEHFMLLPLLAMLYVYIRSRETAAPSTVPRRWFIAGIFACLALMYKYTVLPVVALIYFAWAWDIWRKQRSPMALAHDAASGISGMLLSAAAVLAYFIAHNAVPQLWECTVSFNRYYFAGSVFGGYEAFARHVLEFLKNWWALFVLTGYFLVRRPPRWKFYICLLVSGIAVSYGSVYGHYYIVLMPFWAIVCAAALDSLSGEIAKRRSVNVNLIRTALVAAVLVSMHLLARPPFLCAPDQLESAKFLKQGYFYESADIARRIAGMTSEGDYVLILGSEPQILYYAQRRSPTRFMITYPLMIDTPMTLQYQKEAIRDLGQHPPKVILLARQFYSGKGPALILEYMNKFLSSGDYELLGGYVQGADRNYWKGSIHKEELPNSNLLLFRKKGGII